MGPVVWYVGFIADNSYRAAFSAKEHDPESQMHVQREGMERMVSLDFQISFHAIPLGAFWQVPCNVAIRGHPLCWQVLHPAGGWQKYPEAEGASL